MQQENSKPFWCQPQSFTNYNLPKMQLKQTLEFRLKQTSLIKQNSQISTKYFWLLPNSYQLTAWCIYLKIQFNLYIEDSMKKMSSELEEVVLKCVEKQLKDVISHFSDKEIPNLEEMIPVLENVMNE